MVLIAASRLRVTGFTLVGTLSLKSASRQTISALAFRVVTVTRTKLAQVMVNRLFEMAQISINRVKRATLLTQSAFKKARNTKFLVIRPFVSKKEKSMATT